VPLLDAAVDAGASAADNLGCTQGVQLQSVTLPFDRIASFKPLAPPLIFADKAKLRLTTKPNV
jgi:hypothetical protein